MSARGRAARRAGGDAEDVATVAEAISQLQSIQTRMRAVAPPPPPQ